ncbi:MAG: hypothetical protein WKF37_12975 [Bryobacteraceae bacterium]
MSRLSLSLRLLLAGLTGGAALLFDYSGVVLLLTLFLYAVARSWAGRGALSAMREGAWYVAGTIPPVLLLWFYQWQSFGDPFRPGQHWMPPVEWIGLGYQGFGLPQWELIANLAFDYRYGLFATCPLLLLGLFAPMVDRRRSALLPGTELCFLAGTVLAFGYSAAALTIRGYSLTLESGILRRYYRSFTFSRQLS